LLRFIQSSNTTLKIKTVVLVAKFNPLPILKFGASNGKKLHVEIRPPIFPSMTTVPIADARAVSETTLADAWALQRAPKEKAPEAIRNVAP
jgi:hypothetical protein